MKTVNKSNNKKPIIFLMIFALIMLCIISLVFIYSASNYSAKSTYNDSFYFVKKQAFGFVIGAFIFVLTLFFDIDFLKKFSFPLAIVTIILLCLVFVPGIGVENYGAKRWINLYITTIQPSEIAKFSLILFSATYISKHPERNENIFQVFPILIYGLILCFLIILEPNMSITACVGILLISLLFTIGVKIKYLLFIIIPALILGVVLIIIEPYRFSRLMAFINPWSSPKGEGYQLIQSLYALGSGGFFGVGIFKSRQKYAFLPFSESDFILSVIGEETGFFGVFFLFFIYFLLIFCGFKVAKNAKNTFSYFLSIGISLILTIQTVINALVVSGSIPPTGLPLPLISSGNTSIIVFIFEIGILCNIARNSN